MTTTAEHLRNYALWFANTDGPWSGAALVDALNKAADELEGTDDEPPVGTIVRDNDGDLWLRDLRDEWCNFKGDNMLSWSDIQHYAPLTIVKVVDA